MRLIYAAAAAIALIGAANADTMTFNVSGEGPTGPYTGTVVVTELETEAHGGDVFTVVWTIGPDTIEGVGIVEKDNRKLLSIGYSYKGQPGVAVMIEGEGTAQGVWWVRNTPSAGKETWTPAN